MKKRILEYIKYIETLLKEQESRDIPFDGNPAKVEEIIKTHLTQIEFFMHERLIHLIVTALFALLTMLSFLFFIFTGEIMIFVLTVALMILLIPYIKHYYILENNVQKMYEEYDRFLLLAHKLK